MQKEQKFGAYLQNIALHKWPLFLEFVQNHFIMNRVIFINLIIKHYWLGIFLLLHKNDVGALFAVNLIIKRRFHPHAHLLAAALYRTKLFAHPTTPRCMYEDTNASSLL